MGKNREIFQKVKALLESPNDSNAEEVEDQINELLAQLNPPEFLVRISITNSDGSLHLNKQKELARLIDDRVSRMP